MSRQSSRYSAAVLGAVASASCALAFAARADDAGNDLADLSLQELTNIEVTTFSKRPQRAADVAAALFVLTQDDIRRYGATSIAEALRLVPGLQVARIDGNKWAISSRGFSGRFANKLLVLMDGRTLYTPSFSGVYWDIQDTMIDDIERIEVIRGPAGTTWGTNAVNGIINIITKHADQTDGLLVSTEAGSDGSTALNARFGEADGGGTKWRVFAKVFEHDANVQLNGSDAYDDSQQQRVGARTDTDFDNGQSLRTSFEAYRGWSGDSLFGSVLVPQVAPLAPHHKSRETVDGAWGLVGWTLDTGVDSKLQLQAYYDHSDRSGPLYDERRDTADIDLQHVWPRFGAHTITTGAGVRFNQDYFRSDKPLELLPAADDFWLTSAYLQDEIGLLQDAFVLTAGTRVENAKYGGTAVLPNLRAQFTPSAHSMLWAAIARGERRPSRAERDIYAPEVAGQLPAGVPSNPFPIPLSYGFRGNANFQSEELWAYEGGWRWRPTDAVSLDIAAFYNDYDELRAGSIIEPYCAPSGVAVASNPLCLFSSTQVVTGAVLDNSSSGIAKGIELSLAWTPSTHWRLMATYSHIDKSVSGLRADDPVVLFTIGQDPRNEYSLRSTLSVGPTWDWDVFVKHRDAIPATRIGGFADMDMRIAWRATLDLELALVGRNLLHAEHVEAMSEFLDIGQVAIERTGYLQLRWSFR